MVENRPNFEFDEDDFKDIDNDYLTLGVHPSASDQTLRKKFRDVSKKLHPDKSSHPADTELFQRITAANARIQLYRKHHKVRELNFNKEHECINPAIATDTFEITTTTLNLREFSRGQTVFLDEVVDRTSTGRKRCRCLYGWVSLESGHGLQLFRPVVYKITDMSAKEKEKMRVQQTARPMFGGFSMLCLSTVSFTPSHLPQPLIVHRAYKNEVVDIYDVTAVGRQVRVKTNKGWASMVSRNGLPLLVPDKDFLYAVIKAQTIWRMIYIRKQQRKLRGDDNHEKHLLNESIQAEIDISGVWCASGMNATNDVIREYFWLKQDGKIFYGGAINTIIAAAPFIPFDFSKQPGKLIFKLGEVTGYEVELTTNMRTVEDFAELLNRELLAGVVAYSTGSDDRKTKHDRIALAASGDIDLIEYYPEFCREDDAEPKRDAERSEMRSGQFHDGNRVSFFQVWPDNRGVRWEASVEPGSDKMTDGVWGGQYQNGRWTTGVGASRRFEATREMLWDGNPVPPPTKALAALTQPTQVLIRDPFPEVTPVLATKAMKEFFLKFCAGEGGKQRWNDAIVTVNAIARLRKGFFMVAFSGPGPASRLLMPPATVAIDPIGKVCEVSDCQYPPPAAKNFPGTVKLRIMGVKGVEPPKLTVLEDKKKVRQYGKGKRGLLLKIRCGGTAFERYRGFQMTPTGNYIEPSGVEPNTIFEPENLHETSAEFDIDSSASNPQIIVEVFREGVEGQLGARGSLPVPVGQTKFEISELFELKEPGESYVPDEGGKIPPHMHPPVRPKTDLTLWRELEAMPGMFRDPTAEVQLALEFETHDVKEKRAEAKRAQKALEKEPSFQVMKRRDAEWAGRQPPDFLDTEVIWRAAGEKARKENLTQQGIVEPQGYLAIKIIEGINLKSQDFGSKSDPYVELTFENEWDPTADPARPKQIVGQPRKLRTKAKDNDNNPTWNEWFVFKCTNVSSPVSINVFDKGVLTDELIGTIDTKKLKAIWLVGETSLATRKWHEEEHDVVKNELLTGTHVNGQLKLRALYVDLKDWNLLRMHMLERAMSEVKRVKVRAGCCGCRSREIAAPLVPLCQGDLSLAEPEQEASTEESEEEVEAEEREKDHAGTNK